jgi:hypothetical protein
MISQCYEKAKAFLVTPGEALQKSRVDTTKSTLLFTSKTRVLIVLAIALAGLAIVQTAAAAGPAPVNLGTAGNFAILSKSGITDVPASAVTGDVGTSPISGTAITGLTCAEVTGTIYTVNAAGPACRVVDPARLTTAVSNMETAYTDAAGRTLPDHTELGAGNIGGMTLAPGLYKWGTGVSITNDITLNGGSNDVWIFQIAQGLTVASGKKVILSGGAQSKNIFWQVGSNAEIGTTAQFNGNILAKTAINLRTGASVNGRALAQTAVTLQSNVVTKPGTDTNPSSTTSVPTTSVPVVSTTTATTTTTISSATVTPSSTSSPSISSSLNSVYVTSDPAYAYVYLDTIYKGKTPLTITNVSTGDHEVELNAPGYYSWKTTINLAGGSSTRTVSAQMNPLGGPQVSNTAATASLAPTPTATKSGAAPVVVIAALGIIALVAGIMHKKN